MLKLTEVVNRQNIGRNLIMEDEITVELNVGEKVHFRYASGSIFEGTVLGINEQKQMFEVEARRMDSPSNRVRIYNVRPSFIIK